MLVILIFPCVNFLHIEQRSLMSLRIESVVSCTGAFWSFVLLERVSRHFRDIFEKNDMWGYLLGWRCAVLVRSVVLTVVVGESGGVQGFDGGGKGM